MANEQLKRDNLDNVYKIAYALFLENGIENTSKIMLVRKSQLSLTTVNRYFPSKMDCVTQTAKWVSENVREARVNNSPRFHDAHTGYEALKTYLGVVKTLFFENNKLFVFCSELRAFIYRNSTDAQRDFGILRQAFGSSKFVEDIMLRGMKDGTIKTTFSANHEAILMRETYLGFLVSMAMTLSQRPEECVNLIDCYIEMTLARYGSSFSGNVV